MPRCVRLISLYLPVEQRIQGEEALVPRQPVHPDPSQRDRVLRSQRSTGLRGPQPGGQADQAQRSVGTTIQSPGNVLGEASAVEGLHQVKTVFQTRYLDGYET